MGNNDVSTEKPANKANKRPLASRTRSGRISKPPKHILKDLVNEFNKDNDATLDYKEFEEELLKDLPPSDISNEHLVCKLQIFFL